MVKLIRVKPIEDVSFAIQENSHPVVFGIMITMGLFLLVAAGHQSGAPVSACLAGSIGAFAAAKWVLHFPFNLFGYWKHHRQFSPGERRAITYLAGPEFRREVWKLAFAAAAVPVGTAAWAWFKGYGWESPEAEIGKLPFGAFCLLWVETNLLAMAMAFFGFFSAHAALATRHLRNRWTWIQKTFEPANRDFVREKYRTLYQRYLGLDRD